MLTDTAIRSARPGEKPAKLFDEGGLFLLVVPTGAKLWRWKYRFEGREKLLAFGRYPDVGLRRARERRDEARRLLADGVDPSVQRRAEKAGTTSQTLSGVAAEWLAMQDGKLSPESLARIRDRLEKWVFPSLGSRPLRSLTPPDLLPALKRIEAVGRRETAHRARADLSRLLRYGIATGRAERDVTLDLRGALAPVRSEHFAALTRPADVGALLRAIDGYQGQPSTAIALRLAPLVFVRPGELRSAEWSEFDLAEALWRIPAERMKMRRPHLVPLARQSLALLEDLAALTGAGRLLFPTLRDPTRPMSENTLNAALRRLGYTSEQQTAHGFRTIASTLLNERGVAPDLIERQLAHQEANATRDAYNRAERLDERRKLMQDWADYLDTLKAAK